MILRNHFYEFDNFSYTKCVAFIQLHWNLGLRITRLPPYLFSIVAIALCAAQSGGAATLMELWRIKEAFDMMKSTKGSFWSGFAQEP